MCSGNGFVMQTVTVALTWNERDLFTAYEASVVFTNLSMAVVNFDSKHPEGGISPSRGRFGGGDGWVGCKHLLIRPVLRGLQKGPCSSAHAPAGPGEEVRGEIYPL